jgi:hypothetical protein
MWFFEWLLANKSCTVFPEHFNFSNLKAPEIKSVKKISNNNLIENQLSSVENSLPTSNFWHIKIPAKN